MAIFRPPIPPRRPSIPQYYESKRYETEKEVFERVKPIYDMNNIKIISWYPNPMDKGIIVVFLNDLNEIYCREETALLVPIDKERK